MVAVRVMALPALVTAWVAKAAAQRFLCSAAVTNRLT